jgi:Protein of unknown function (DUF1629)
LPAYRTAARIGLPRDGQWYPVELKKEAGMFSNAPIPVATGNTFEKGKFFIIEPSFWGGGKSPGLEIANESRLALPGAHTVEPPNGDPNQYPERPHLIHMPEQGGLPRDFENLYGIWIVSEALKRVFESIDPDGFVFVACDFTLSDGTPGPAHYFCNAMRTLDALDEAASRLKIKVGDYVNGKYYSLAGGASLVFKQDIIGSAHVFRTPFADTVFCDRALYDAVTAANVAGVEFLDVANC